MKKPSAARIEKLRKQRRKLLEEIGSLSLLVHGSLFERFSTCSRPHCACHQGERHGPRTYVAVTQDKVQRQHFIRKGQVAAIKRGIRQYHRLRELTRRITRINLELMRQDALREAEPP